MGSQQNRALSQGKPKVQRKITLKLSRVRKPSPKPRINHGVCSYNKKSFEDLKTLAIQRGIDVSKIHMHYRLVKILKKRDHEECKYLKFTIKEMMVFAQNRKLGFTKKRPWKQDIIDVLEKADREWTFPLMELPTELRLMVYTFAVATEVTNPKQPSLTKVSRLVRRESLPIFYGTNLFSIHFCDCLLVHKNSAHMHLSGFSSHRFRSITDRNLANIEFLEISMPLPSLLVRSRDRFSFRIQCWKPGYPRPGSGVSTKVTYPNGRSQALLRSLLAECQMTEQDLLCSMLNVFRQKAFNRSHKLWIEGFHRFAEAMPIDVTQLGINCIGVGCSVHSEPS